VGLVGFSLQASDDGIRHRQLLDLVWIELTSLPDKRESGIVQVKTDGLWRRDETLADRLFMEQARLAISKEDLYLVTSLAVPKCLVVNGQEHHFPIVSHWTGKDSDGKIGNLRLALVEALNKTGKLRVDDPIEVKNSIGGTHFPFGFVYRLSGVPTPAAAGTGA
jgi:hypothetical protein